MRVLSFDPATKDLAIFLNQCRRFTKASYRARLLECGLGSHCLPSRLSHSVCGSSAGTDRDPFVPCASGSWQSQTARRGHIPSRLPSRLKPPNLLPSALLLVPATRTDKPFRLGVQFILFRVHSAGEPAGVADAVLGANPNERRAAHWALRWFFGGNYFGRRAWHLRQCSLPSIVIQKVLPHSHLSLFSPATLIRSSVLGTIPLASISCTWARA